MKKRFLFLFIFCVFFCLCSCSLTNNRLITIDTSQEVVKVVNTVSEKYIKSNVMVKVVEKNTMFGITTSESISQGSGAIIKEDATYYYALTNNHVVYKKSADSDISYSVITYDMKTIKAELLYQSSDYDLALIRFRKGDNSLVVLNISKQNPIIGDKVVAMGQPLGQMNSVTLGTVLSYVKPELNEEEKAISNITFNVLVEDAPMHSGSSGGALLNFEYELVGINFAVSVDQTTGQFKYAFSIPSLKIQEFLSQNNFTISE